MKPKQTDLCELHVFIFGQILYSANIHYKHLNEVFNITKAFWGVGLVILITPNQPLYFAQ